MCIRDRHYFAEERRKEGWDLNDIRFALGHKKVETTIKYLARFPADIVSKNDFDFMRQDGDIGSMDYDQAVKNGEIFFGWSAWMEQDGYAPGESIVFDFENGSETYTYQGKIAGSFVSADTYLGIPEGVYLSLIHI